LMASVQAITKAPASLSKLTKSQRQGRASAGARADA
jgi:hypothetical protein